MKQPTEREIALARYEHAELYVRRLMALLRAARLEANDAAAALLRLTEESERLPGSDELRAAEKELIDIRVER